MKIEINAISLRLRQRLRKIKFTFLRDGLFGLLFSVCSKGFWWDLYSISEKSAESSGLKHITKDIFSVF